MGFLFDGSALSENEIGGSPTSRGCSSPHQIHEEAVQQHNDQNAERDEGGADECRCTFRPTLPFMSARPASSEGRFRLNLEPARRYKRSSAIC
jgi:hypothetical protein